MNNSFKHLRLLALGVALLSTNVFAAANECFSTSELNDFKSLYIQLQQQLNYEGKDAYLDKNFVVQLKPHEKNAPYPGKEFEDALFNEYQNSLRKVGKLYQAAKFEGDDGFKSNDLLVNFMKAIDDKSSDSSDFVNKTKMKDVINALEVASKKKYGNSKFAINAGDKYLLEKLLTHAQDRVCSLNKFEGSHKGTSLFKSDYLQKVKNAPLNVLINSIKNAPIEKDSKIELKESSDLTASLVDPNIAVKSAIADNLNQLSAWVKKVKAQGPKCLDTIKSKTFANQIQGQIQGCNFGQFIETLSHDNVNNLESVLHFINANEKLLNNASAKAETNSDELKLEGFVGQTFENLGTVVRCSELNPANSGDKKVFIRNLPYNEKSNQFDTSGIICKSNSKILGADSCRKQFDLSSDSLGRGLEIKPKKGASDSLTFSVKDSESCADISFKNPNNEIDLSTIATLEQCVALKKEGSVFNWDASKKSCGEFSALLVNSTLKQAAQQCVAQKKNGYAYKWDSSKNSCDEIPTIAGTKLESKISCDAKSAANLPFKWNASNNLCESSPVLTAAELKARAACEATPSKNGFSNSWNNQSRQCNQVEVTKIGTIEQCVALKKPGSVFNWDATKKSCGEFSALLSDAALKQAAQQCEIKGPTFKWNSTKKDCDEVSAAIGAKGLELKNISSIEQCVAMKKEGSVFNWDSTKNSCHEFSALLSNAALTQAAQQCEVKQKDGSSFKWDSSKNACSEFSTLANSNTKNSISQAELAKVSSLEQCVALTKPGSVFNWNKAQNSCVESSALLTNAAQTQAAQQCAAQKKNGYDYKWNSDSKSCQEIPTIAGTKLQAKISCDAKTAAGFAYKWNASEFLCEKTNVESRSPALSDSDLKVSETKDQSPKAPEKSSPDLTSNAVTTQSQSAIKPAVVAADVSYKEAKMSCETKSSPGNLYRWNSITKSCEAPTSAPASSSKAPSTKPIILTSDANKPTTPNITPPVVGTKQPEVSTREEIKNTPVTKPSISQKQQKPQDQQIIDPPLSNLPDGNANNPKLDCETQSKEGFAYKWMADSTKCLEQTVEAAKIDCEANKKEGFEYKWLSDSVKCIEVPTNAVADKKEEKKDEPVDTALADAEKECIADNTKWIDEKNDGRPGIRYEWDSEKKSCIDKRPDKDGGKKVVEEEAPEIEAPSNPKRAPARFVPINIPSRQIYLMPGMP